MDPVRFHRITRQADAPPSRRAALGLLLALAAAVHRPAPAAACVDAESNRTCSRDNDCCGGNVRCRRERCQCMHGLRACREHGSVRCVDRRADPDHCGRCGRRCRDGEWCERGRCLRYHDDGRRCVVREFCGRGRPRCCRGFACRAGLPSIGLGVCVPV